jgi:hypothetical protein
VTDLDELERLLEQATPGPWWVYVHTGDGTSIGPGDDWTVYGNGREPVVHEGSFTVHAAANAALIAALRNCAEELVRDARRYWWLTHCGAFTVGRATSAPWGLHLSGSATDPADLDAAIDAAIAQERP